MWKHSTLMESFTAFSYSFLRTEVPFIRDVVCYCDNNSKKNKDKTYFVLPEEPNLRNSWIRTINRTSLPKRVFICSDHFEESCFDSNWDLQNRLFYTERSVKRKLIAGAIPTIFPHKTQPKERTSSKARAKKSEKNEVRI